MRPNFLARRLAALAGALLTAACARPAAPAMPGPVTAFESVNVIPMDRDGVLANQTVLVSGGRIVQAGPAGRVRVPDGATRIDGRGRYLMPGLWDMHVHAWNRPLFEAVFLANGITGIRDMGSGMDPLFGGREGVWAWRDSVRAGLPGPRIVAGGHIVNGGAPPFPFFVTANTPDEGRRWVDSLAARGADFIKVYSALDPATYAAIAERARERGLPIAGHVPARVGTIAASRAGQRSMEHLFDLLVAASMLEPEMRAAYDSVLRNPEFPAAAAQTYEGENADRLLRAYDPARAQAMFAELRRNDTYIVPTLVTIGHPRCLDPAATGVDSARLMLLHPAVRGFVQPAADAQLERRCRRFEAELRLVGEMQRAGVPLLAGSDTPQPSVYPGFALHEELALLVRAGLTPQEALRAATLAPARYLGAADSLGAVRAGMQADLLLLDANPLEAITSTRRIAGVMTRGVWIPREELDRRVRAAATPPPRP